MTPDLSHRRRMARTDRRQMSNCRPRSVSNGGAVCRPCSWQATVNLAHPAKISSTYLVRDAWRGHNSHFADMGMCPFQTLWCISSLSCERRCCSLDDLFDEWRELARSASMRPRSRERRDSFRSRGMAWSDLCSSRAVAWHAPLQPSKTSRDDFDNCLTAFLCCWSFSRGTATV